MIPPDKSTTSCPDFCPSNTLPNLKVEPQIIGKVSGLPKNVPKAEAIILPPMVQAMIPAIMKCSPKKGVKATKTPVTKPRAMLCGEAAAEQSRLPIAVDCVPMIERETPSRGLGWRLDQDWLT